MPSLNSVEHLFPHGVVLEWRPVLDAAQDLFPCERVFVERAVPKRRNEFATGRLCARAALARLGVCSQPIPVGAFREPLFPPGIVGSITHDLDTCVCVAALDRQVCAIGIDLTSAAPLDPRLRSIICTTEEIEHFGDATRYRYDPYKLTFSAKEALYKTIYPFVNRFIEFNEVSLEVDPELGTWRPRFVTKTIAEHCRQRVEGRWIAADGFIFTGAWMMPSA